MAKKKRLTAQQRVNLTPRQVELYEKHAGKSPQQVAKAEGISVSAAKAHITRITRRGVSWGDTPARSGQAQRLAETERVVRKAGKKQTEEDKVSKTYKATYQVTAVNSENRDAAMEAVAALERAIADEEDTIREVDERIGNLRVELADAERALKYSLHKEERLREAHKVAATIEIGYASDEPEPTA